MNCHDVEPLLNPCLDGELDVSAVLELERHLAGCPACQRQYRKLETLREELAASALDFQPPPRLARRIQRSINERSRWWQRPAWLATAAAALLIVLVVPARLYLGTAGMDREVLDGHLRSLLPSHLIDVPSSDQHTVKPWFQGQLGFSPSVPDLSAEGFVLVGGRVDVIQQRRAAAVVYKRRQHIINLFIAETRLPDRTSETEGFHLIRWSKGPLTYWAISDLNMAELRQFSDLVRSK